MSRESIEKDLIAAERRAADGRFKIARQLDSIADLARRELSAVSAQRTLATLREEQTIHDMEVERLLAELRKVKSASTPSM